ncbi:MAG: hypothetical protein IPM56_10780 [Ignavibacteriales bacterium]|nr:MAG: hypothetical protein IPM56_10780 [Ignavibacteriales bacterium]
MASVKKAILGQLNGGIADVVFKSKNGKGYVASKPASMKVSNSPRSVEIRSKFRISIKFAQMITSNLMLKDLWKSVKPQNMSAANYIVRENYPFITQTGINNGAQIVPGFGFTVDGPVISLTGERLRVDINALGNDTGIVPASEPNLRLLSVIMLTSPVNVGQKPVEFMALSSPSVPTVVDAALNFTADLSNQQENLFSLYQTSKAFCIIVSLSPEQNIVHYSSTFTD